MSEQISYEWLKQNGFRLLERLERQPFDHYRRCLGAELIGKHFMTAHEDICIDVAPDRFPHTTWWYVWITRASAQNQHPSVWVHTRHMATVGELILLYEALTGRKFGQPTWNRKELGEPLFEEPSIA